MFCPKCGFWIPDDARCCSNCGDAFQMSSDFNIIEPTASEPATASNSVAFADQSYAPSSKPLPSKQKNPSHIRSLALAILIALFFIGLLICALAHNSQPTYALSSQTIYGSDSFNTPSDDDVYSRGADGALLERVSRLNNQVFRYQSLGCGVTIPEGATGSYETNLNGDVISVQYVDKDGVSYLARYKYFKPGVIEEESTTETHPDTTVTTTIYEYDQAGWLIYSSIQTDGFNPEVCSYSYDFIDKDTVFQTTYDDRAQVNATSKQRIKLDDYGNPISTFDGDRLTISRTYEPIDNPSSFIAATSRLKW